MELLLLHLLFSFSELFLFLYEVFGTGISGPVYVCVCVWRGGGGMKRAVGIVLTRHSCIHMKTRSQSLLARSLLLMSVQAVRISLDAPTSSLFLSFFHFVFLSRPSPPFSLSLFLSRPRSEFSMCVRACVCVPLFVTANQ